MSATLKFASAVASSLQFKSSGWFLVGFLIAVAPPAFSDVLEDAQKHRVIISAGDVTLGATLFRPRGALSEENELK
jgi:hypothetical protein